MHTLCPNCNHSQKVSRRQLKKKRSQLTCSKCKQQFNAYATLSEMPPLVQETETSEPELIIPETPSLLKIHDQAVQETTIYNQSIIELFDWQKTTTSHPERWLIGVIMGLFLFIFQIYYFQGYSLSQNPQIRPWLTKLSSYISYPLAVYRNPQEFTTIGSALTSSGGDTYRLQVSFINHADFRQSPPYLQLTLQNFYGGVFAQRIFSPQEYLGRNNSVTPIMSSATLDVDFQIATPEQDTGGYSIELK